MTIDRRKLKKMAESMRVWLTKEQKRIISEIFLNAGNLLTSDGIAVKTIQCHSMTGVCNR
ncbi:MAG: hypothetical protein LBI03_05500 [Clostridiales bacterium]|jgi:hypothetical protein|nr:hypothetical protein [Clostridiales bacterium]